MIYGGGEAIKPCKRSSRTTDDDTLAMPAMSELWPLAASNDVCWNASVCSLGVKMCCGHCNNTGRKHQEQRQQTGTSRRASRAGAWALTVAILLSCPSWSSGLHLMPAWAPSVSSPYRATRQCYPAARLSAAASGPRHARAPRVAVIVCKDTGGEVPGPPLTETRAMNWEDDAARDASKSMDKKKNLRIAQLRAELQDVVRAETYAEAAILQEQIQALERTAVRKTFDQVADTQQPSTRASTSLVFEDESLLSRSRGPMQRRPSRTLQTQPTKVLTDRERTREDEFPDAEFYQEARMVTHVDVKFALRLQELYKKRLLPGSAVLDLGAACVSYLPDGVELRDVVSRLRLRVCVCTCVIFCERDCKGIITPVCMHFSGIACACRRLYVCVMFVWCMFACMCVCANVCVHMCVCVCD